MTRKNYIFAFVCACALVLSGVTNASPAHTFHTSLMQIEYNEEEQLLEVSLQVFTHDLVRVLSFRSGKNVILDETPETARLTLAYLNETINLKNQKGQLKTLSWVGMEIKADAVWIYVETKMPEGLDGMQVRDRIFFGALDDQVNRVHIKLDGKKYDLVFKPGDDFKPIANSTGGAN